MPVDFLSQEQRSRYGRFTRAPSPEQLLPEAVARGELRPLREADVLEELVQLAEA